MDEWEKYELHHRARLAIKPGLTGMWQVSGRSEITDFEEVVKLDTKYISEKALREAKEKAPKNAIILAAGFGMRMVPINTETPKGLLEIKGERLIECTIRQLHEVGITEIYVVVGFMKEQYEYLIDEYGVELIVAPDYASKNNLHSLKTAADHLSNSYIIDLYFEGNCDDRTRIKIYCYIAVCGLLWSNWCEYKRNLGVEFGEYSLRQYRYAKDYYKIVQQELGEEEKETCTK